MAKKIKITAPDLLADIFKRVSISGLGELKLPKEVMHAAVTNIEKFRQGVLDVFSAEFEKNLSRIDFRAIADNVMKNYTLKVNAELRLEPKRKSKKKAKTS